MTAATDSTKSRFAFDTPARGGYASPPRSSDTPGVSQQWSELVTKAPSVLIVDSSADEREVLRTVLDHYDVLSRA